MADFSVPVGFSLPALAGGGSREGDTVHGSGDSQQFDGSTDALSLGKNESFSDG